MARKGNNIYKRKDGRWEGRYIRARTPEGRAIYGSVYARSYREAVRKLSELTDSAEATVPLWAEAEDVRFCTLGEAWLENRRPQIKESAYNKYRNLFCSYIRPQLGELPLSRLTPGRLNRLCSDLLTRGGSRGQGLSPKTVNDTLAVIRNILRFAECQGYRPPCTGQEITVRQSPREMQILARSDQDRLTRYLCGHQTREGLGILLCLFTGLRIGEICALQWSDISLEEKTLHVRQTMQRIQCQGAERRTRVTLTAPKSRCSVRTIPIPEPVFCLLEPYAWSSRGFFLTGREDRYVEPRMMQYHLKRILLACGVEPVNFHALRHTFATRCVEAGFDVKSLSEILGHASVSITMNRYVHPSMELKKENMQRLSAFYAVR